MQAIKQLTDRPELLQSIGKNAQKLVYEQFDNSVLTKKLIDFFAQTEKRS